MVPSCQMDADDHDDHDGPYYDGVEEEVTLQKKASKHKTNIHTSY